MRQGSRGEDAAHGHEPDSPGRHGRAPERGVQRLGRTDRNQVLILIVGLLLLLIVWPGPTPGNNLAVESLTQAR